MWSSSNGREIARKSPFRKPLRDNSAAYDVEIRRMTLINRSLLPRTLELTSYIELAMAPHAADLQHSAFQKMFIHTEGFCSCPRTPMLFIFIGTFGKIYLMFP